MDMRVLIVEDEAVAAEILPRLLGQTGWTIESRVVECAEDFQHALAHEEWHVILADYTLPQFSAPEALRMLQESGLDIPFIVVSGRIGEETAADMMRSGADDFVNKIDYSRLLPAVTRAVAEANTRRERRAAEADRLRLGRDFRNVVRENIDGMVILAEDGTVLYANPAAESMLGRQRVQVFGQEFGTPSFAGSTVEIQLVRAGGELISVEMRASATVWDDRPALLLSLRDITERKQAEEIQRRLNRALKVLSKSNRTLVRASREEDLLQDVCKIVVEVGNHAFAWVGLTAEGNHGLVRPVAWAGNGEAYLDELRAHRRAPESGCCPIWKGVLDGTPCIIQDTADTAVGPDSLWREAAVRHGFQAAAALPLVTGTDVIGAISIYAGNRNVFEREELDLLDELAEDLAFGIVTLRRETARKASEIALRASEERFRKTLLHAPMATMVHAEDGEVIMINEAWTRITGYSLEDIPTTRAWFEKAYGDKADDVEAIMRRLYKYYVPDTPGEFVIRTKTGEQRHLYFSIAPLGHLPDGRRAIIGMAIDVTAQRAAQDKLRESEEQVLQLQKLESIGRLAGGVAHDFNNVLHAIGGYTEFALAGSEKISEVHGDIEAIRDLVKRASALTQQLLAFSRRQTLQFEVLDLNEEIAESIKLLRRLIGEDIEIQFLPAENLAMVKADPGQLYQVIMNLSINARQAMPTGGSLTIETANEEIDEFSVSSHVGLSPGSYVVTTLSDTGTGMSAETCERIFEPFFSTKGAGEGTGLGLSTVYGIVKQHGGDIRVHSVLGQGTAFKIYLPKTREEVEHAPEKAAVINRDGRGKKILIAEDESPVRFVLSRILQNSGYEVIAAESPADAIERAMECESEIALFITDVVMPGMSGPELLSEIRQRFPKIPALFMSGYTDDTVFKHGVQEENTPFIQKPFNSRTLLDKVQMLISPN